MSLVSAVLIFVSLLALDGLEALPGGPPGSYYAPAPACGGQLLGETGSLAFPSGGGDKYPHGVTCIWRLTTTPNKVLLVTFTEFRLESHPSCNYDYLEIRDGSHSSSSLIGKYCGSDSTQGLMGKTITSSGNVLYLKFESDSSVNDEGFTFTWQAVDGVGGGYISSPNYPSNYDNNQDVTWIIAANPGMRVRITFSALDLESSDDCIYDYVQFFNGLVKTSSTELGKFCGAIRTSITSSTNIVSVVFHSDSSVTASGFRFRWFSIY